MGDSAFTQELADKICEMLAKGESLRSICRRENMPPESNVRFWVETREDFAAQYARARNKGLDAMADEILAISDDASDDIRFDGEGNEYVAHDHINRARLRVDARKWYLSKLAPKRYGEKLTTEVTGVDGAPVQTVVTIKRAVSDESK